MSILFALTPAESKRLIARGVKEHPWAKQALAAGRILISSGSTTGYVVEELLSREIDIAHFPCGVVTEGVPCQTPEDRIRSIMIRNGIAIENDLGMTDYEELSVFANELGPGDLYIKGANAIDSEGCAGFLLAHPTGGNIMTVLPRVMAQGVRFLIPTGLEKMIGSVRSAHRCMSGIGEYNFTFGRGCGYVTIDNGLVFHELSALQLLTGVTGCHVASGGIGGSEGAVTLVVDGTKDQLSAAVELIRRIKGEPPLKSWKKRCADCTFRCKYIFGNETEAR